MGRSRQIPTENHEKENRRNFTAEFKARVALEAARGLETINEIAAEHDLHPVQAGQWKKDLLEGAAAVFERGGAVKKDEEAAERERARLCGWQKSPRSWDCEATQGHD
jgi:transposase